MTIQATTHKAVSRKKRSALLLGLGLGVALAGVVALGGVARQAEAGFPGNNGKIVFASTMKTPRTRKGIRRSS